MRASKQGEEESVEGGEDDGFVLQFSAFGSALAPFSGIEPLADPSTCTGTFSLVPPASTQHPQSDYVNPSYNRSNDY
jgi:hypothetical protein